MENIVEQTNWKKLNREERGQLIFKNLKILKTPGGWRVPSQTNTARSYLVKFKKDNPRCQCPDSEIRKEKCKHIFAVEFFIKKEISNEGKITTTKGVRITYSQQWQAYDKSQTNEKLFLFQLLRDLCDFIEEPEYKFGRPKVPLQDLVFSSAIKVYTTFSLRRCMSDLKIAREMGFIDKIPCYASIGHFMQKEELTPVLKKLIQISATPLAQVETDLTLDSSGFSTSRFARYYNYKYQKETTYRVWLKAHLLSGVKTNIVVSAEITEGHENDSPQLASLIKGVGKRFNVKEVSCDRAYCSKENFKLIQDEGALPFIPFKTNVTGKRAKYPIWNKMYYYFLYKHQEFLEHYHKRSNSETVFHKIKAKFLGNLRSKTKTAQINELYLKILCENICVVIQEVNELGLKGEFTIEQSKF